MFPQLPATVRVFLCTRPTDMRKSFDRLHGMVHEFVGQDPLSGHLFLFLNRRRDRVKILLWERDGLVIWYKRLEAGTFQQLDPAACTGCRSRGSRHRVEHNRARAPTYRRRLGLGATAQTLRARRLITFSEIVPEASSKCSS